MVSSSWLEGAVTGSPERGSWLGWATAWPIEDSMQSV